MGKIRIFDVPDEVLEDKNFKMIVGTLTNTKKKDKELYEHMVSTANFVYMYCSKYEKENTNRVDAFIAALLFNFWKIMAPQAKNKEKSYEEEKEIIEANNAARRDIAKNTSSSITDILYVKDERGQHIHEVIYTCNALDNILCLKDDKGKPLSIPTVLSVMSSSQNFSPAIVKKIRDFFIDNIEAYAEEFKVSFVSKDEMRAFEELNGDAKEALFAAVSAVMEGSKRPVAIKELEMQTGSDVSQIIMFTSSEKKVLKFYDKRTQCLYET